MVEHKASCEFYVLMIRRKDNQIYADMAKTDHRIFCIKDDAIKALNQVANPDSWQIVKMTANIKEDDQ